MLIWHRKTSMTFGQNLTSHARNEDEFSQTYMFTYCTLESVIDPQKSELTFMIIHLKYFDDCRILNLTTYFE